MGLCTTHGAWTGTHHAFNRWRSKIAQAAGYGRGDWGDIAADKLLGEWDDVPQGPLQVLLAHSDSQGVIHPEHAAPLADALETFFPAFVALGLRLTAKRPRRLSWDSVGPSQQGKTLGSSSPSSERLRTGVHE